MIRIALLLIAVVAVAGFADAQEEQQAPIVVHMAVPFYPPLARTARVEGDVHLRVVTDGQKVTTAKAEDGHKALADAAEQNVRTWQFASHVATSFTVTFRFRIVDDVPEGRNRLLLQLPLEVQIETLRWPGTVDLSPKIGERRSKGDNAATVLHETLHAEEYRSRQ